MVKKINVYLMEMQWPENFENPFRSIKSVSFECYSTAQKRFSFNFHNQIFAMKGLSFRHPKSSVCAFMILLILIQLSVLQAFVSILSCGLIFSDCVVRKSNHPDYSSYIKTYSFICIMYGAQSTSHNISKRLSFLGKCEICLVIFLGRMT